MSPGPPSVIASDCLAGGEEVVGRPSGASHSHASYMRYWRAANNPKRCGTKIHQLIKEKGHVFDLWMESKENWDLVNITFQKWELSKNKSFNMDSYRTKDQLVKFYGGNLALVESIIREKCKRGSPWMIPHPECPDREDARLYLAWGGAGQSTMSESGTKTSMSGDTDVDLNDKQTVERASSFMASPAAKLGPPMALPGSDNISLASSPSPKPAEKVRENKPKKEKDPWDTNRAKITKLGNIVKTCTRQVQGIIVEVQGMQPSDETQIYTAKANRFKSSLNEHESALDEALALRRRATPESLDKTWRQHEDAVMSLRIKIGQFEKLVCPGPAKARAKTAAKSRAAPSRA